MCGPTTLKPPLQNFGKEYPVPLNYITMRTITEVSKILEANNDAKSTYIVVTFGATLENGDITPSCKRCLFEDTAFLKQVKPGMRMPVEPLA